MIFNLPNLITISRLVLIPFVGLLMYLMAQPSWYEKQACLGLVAGIIFIVAAITDIIDGYLARKLGQVSLVGKFFDPMADKLIHMTVLIFLIPLNRVPAWIVVVLLFREIFVTGLRSIAVGEGLVIAADKWGKWKAVWLNVSLSSLIIHEPIFAGTFFAVQTRPFGLACLAIATFCALVSGIQYTTRFWKMAQQKGL